ncbi:hypothetical protein KKD03_05500 [Patescibacteria group bacterium]|nr:hypothetical protein [Patescibacteria group bacterium]
MLEEEIKSEKKQKVVNKPEKSKKLAWLKWLAGIIVILLLFGAFQFYKFQKDSELRREAIQAQEFKLREFYQDQGLSEEEIDQKIKTERVNNFPREDEDSLFRTVFRTIRHTTGTGGVPGDFR